MTKIDYFGLRADWYRGGDLMARLISKSSKGEVYLVNFPAQWIPIFEYFGSKWGEPKPPAVYIPIVSDVSVQAFVEIVNEAKEKGHLRVLAESVSALDPLLADVLYRLDHKHAHTSTPLERYIPITGWQSYGRPEIIDFSNRVSRTNSASCSVAVLLPCARRRPYSNSKTHKRLLSELVKSLTVAFDAIVISSLGVVPSVFWNDPVVLSYDSGVPDIYRVLRLMREFFARVRYEKVVDCLEFEPYRDCLRIILREGLVGEIREGPVRRVKRLPGR